MNSTKAERDISHVIYITGCTKEQALENLIADEWSIGWAIAHIQDAQKRGVYLQVKNDA